MSTGSARVVAAAAEIGGGTFRKISTHRWGTGGEAAFDVEVSGSEDLLINTWALSDAFGDAGVGIHIDRPSRPDEGLIGNPLAYSSAALADRWTVGQWAYARNGSEAARAVQIALNGIAIDFPLTAGIHRVSFDQFGASIWQGPGMIVVFHVAPAGATSYEQAAGA